MKEVKIMFYLLNINNFCKGLSPVLILIGHALNIFKLCLPLILIVLGIVDIGKAVISSKSEDVKKNMKNFFKKVLVCALVFFIPTVGMVVFGFIEDFTEIRENSGLDFDVCYNCLFDSGGEICKNAVSKHDAK